MEEAEEERFRMIGDPTEGALVVLAAKAGLWADRAGEEGAPGGGGAL